jgi:hypothetical protein
VVDLDVVEDPEDEGAAPETWVLDAGADLEVIVTGPDGVSERWEGPTEVRFAATPGTHIQVLSYSPVHTPLSIQSE